MTVKELLNEDRKIQAAYLNFLDELKEFNVNSETNEIYNQIDRQTTVLMWEMRYQAMKHWNLNNKEE